MRATAVISACLAAAVGVAAHGHHEEEFDFVIVGGGLAGSVLANRLSASGRHSVLLLNVAGTPPKAYSGPVVITDEFIIQQNLTASSGLKVQIEQPGYSPVPHFSTTETGSSPARWLGGSSLVGLSIYLRDHPELLDWGHGWNFDSMTKYFYRAEDGSARAESKERATADRIDRPADYGQKGPYKIAKDAAYTHPLTEKFIAASREAGLPRVADLNSERGEGVGVNPVSQHADGAKMTAYSAYLKPALGRKNLVVRTGVRADRLIIKDHLCHGVAYRELAAWTDKVVRAKREVIVASNYIYSPRLLFLSGLGPKEDLEAVGLKVVRDLPAVGKHLTSARYTPLAFKTEVPTLSQMLGTPVSPAGTTPEPKSYGSAVQEATARFRSGLAPSGTERPDVVVTFMPLFYAPKSAPLQFSFQGEAWPLKTNAFTLLVTLGETEAKGSVTFPSASPDVSPVVTMDPLTDGDLKLASEAVAWARQLGNSSALGGAFIENGAGAPDMWSALYDGRGSCRMGGSKDTSVVDGKLRVHGVSKLRVVDGSVIPRGSPYLAVPEVLALAERAADLILEDHGYDPVHSERPALDEGGAVTVPGLTELLGEGFPMMTAVNHLAGRGTAEASPAQLAAGASAAGAMIAPACVAAAAFLLVTIAAASRCGERKQELDAEAPFVTLG